MSRVTPAEVKAIIATPLEDSVIEIWIDAANTIVNANAECIGGDEALLKQIELYLSAHFVGMLDASTRGFITEEGIEGFKTKYSNPVSLSSIIEATPWGATANMLSNNCLSSIPSKTATVEFF